MTRRRSFTPIALVAKAPSVIVVNPKVPANNIGELVELASTRPDSLSYASYGNGSSAHLAGEMLRSRAGIAVLHVPYRGSAPAKTATMSGEVSMTFEPAFTAAPLIKSGQLKPIALMGDKRSPALPDVPTVARWATPAWTCRPGWASSRRQTCRRHCGGLAAEIRKVMADPEVQAKLIGSGASPWAITSRISPRTCATKAPATRPSSNRPASGPSERPAGADGAEMRDTANTMPNKPLQKYRVLDLTRVLAGPWCTQNLADLGAEVIKVERPASATKRAAGDRPGSRPGRPASAATPPTSARPTAAKSITIDFTTAQGQALVRQLAADCDVLVENYKTGTLARYGLGYEDLKAVNPGLVYCSVTGFGHTGPYRHKPGYDFVFQAMSGLMSITGERDDLPGGGPQKVGIAVADITTGMYSTVAVLAALLERESHGRGQHLDMALLDCAMAFNNNQAVNYMASGACPAVTGTPIRTPCRTRYSTPATARSWWPSATMPCSRRTAAPHNAPTCAPMRAS